MKKVLTTVMILGAVITLEAIQPLEAAVTQPVVSSTDQGQVTDAGFWRVGPYGYVHHYWVGPFGGIHRGWRW
jgi:hypothetical protein